MYFKQFLDERLGCASYLIASRQTGEAAIVDPSVEIEQYNDVLRQRGFSLRYLIDTHVHADHVSGARTLAAQHGAEVCLFESAGVSYPFRGLHDGEELPLGPLRLRVLHTPGHRPELISLLVTNPERSPEPSMVMTGDSLLVGDVGRPDFGGAIRRRSTRVSPVCCGCRIGWRSSPGTSRGRVARGCAGGRARRSASSGCSTPWRGLTASRSSRS